MFGCIEGLHAKALFFIIQCCPAHQLVVLYFFVTRCEFQLSSKGLFNSDNGGGICFQPCAQVRLSVCKITQKRVHGFG